MQCGAVQLQFMAVLFLTFPFKLVFQKELGSMIGFHVMNSFAFCFLTFGVGFLCAST